MQSCVFVENMTTPCGIKPVSSYETKTNVACESVYSICCIRNWKWYKQITVGKKSFSKRQLLQIASRRFHQGCQTDRKKGLGQIAHSHGELLNFPLGMSIQAQVQEVRHGLEACSPIYF